MTLELFVRKTLDLLNKEREAEVEETRVLTEKLPPKELQRRGVCLLKLRLAGRNSGLYGRTLVTFEPFWAGKDFPSHNLTPGDIIGLTLSQGETQNEALASGIVSKVGQSQISIAFDETHDIFSLDDEVQYKLTKLANDVTYRRLKRALNDLNNYSSGRASCLVNVLFGVSELSPPTDPTDIKYVNESLDTSQREAVEFALRQRELSVIHGPPGTGKTTTVVEIILQAVRRGMKVVACAPSNVAVDNLVERLSHHLQKILRIGHPARLLPHIQKYSLDAIVSGSDENKLVHDVRRDLDKAISKVKQTRNKGEKQGLREEMRHLRKELVRREETATREILRRADVVLVTLTSASNAGPLRLLDEEHFDLVVIDECSQALEAACWMALLRAPRCVLAGDHHQLPPTILSHEAARGGLELTLMERVLKEQGEEVVRMLTTQYRMNENIMQWSSDQLYNGRLIAHDSVKTHLLRDLPGVSDCEETSCPLLLVDTAGCDLSELELPEEVSKGNEGEADIVASHVEKLISSGLQPENIAVIAPYNLQVELLRVRLSPTYPKLEIKSVDGFQGREKEAVVISFVRSNSKGEVGFLSENRRINVAITRARRHVAVICDSETVSHDKFLKTLVEYFTERGEVWSAQEYIQDGKVTHTSSRPEQLENLLSVKSSTKQKSASKGEGHKQRKGDKGHQKQVKKPGQRSNEGGARPKQPASDEGAVRDVEEKEAEYVKYLEDFLANPDQTYLDFPASLNSHDRLVVHQLSEKLGLLHNSKGEGKDRHIVVSKPGIEGQEVKVVTSETTGQGHKPDVKVKTKPNRKEQKNTQDKENKQINDSSVMPDGIETDTPEEVPCGINGDHVEKKRDKVTCEICGKEVLNANIQLHSVHCARQVKAKLTQGQGQPSKDEVKSKKKTKNTKQDAALHRTASALEKIDDDDFDSLIATVQKLDNRCCFTKCKQFTTTLGHTCDFCLRRFCLAHHIPEIHGCGADAKVAARQAMVKEGILFRGNVAPQRKLDPNKRAGLQRKLDKKLDDMAGKRSSKTSKK
ncbi:DNA-binding protein SMUBP-2-like [Haliotis rufescens]|uniref:DNA-binding protein SMUBP-2-like n=1 Tax=Haliotis rufescens TaxID=6454 RepID=UPI001EAFA643|nr:DNA-binding protein SMUBP-2-like [Haliotis rufescens]